MRTLHPFRLLSLASLMLLLAACGSGGGATPVDPGGPVPARLALLKATLLGSLETLPVDPDAQGTILIDLREDGRLEFGCAAQPAWVGDVTGMHVHRGAAGVDGGIEVDLLGGGATFDAADLSASGTLQIDPALAAEIAATPGDFYVNIHTTGAAAGLVRQQLAGDGAIEAATILLGANEIPAAPATGQGACVLSVGADHSIDYVIALKSPAVGDVTAAHVHIGGAGTVGIPLVDLQPLSAAADAANGTLTGNVDATLAQIARVCNDLEGFYVNVHTAAFPGGAARGQLGDGPIEFWMPLEADNVLVAPSNPAARGGVAMQFDSLTTGRAHLSMPPAQPITSLTGAAIREGAAGQAGGPDLIDLRAGADYDASTLGFSAEGAITCTPDLLARLMADPGRFHGIFATATDPTGIARGQVARDPVTFVTSLAGANVVPPAVPPGSGTLSVVATGMFHCSFTFNMTVPVASLVTSCGVNDAPAGSNGPQLIDLFGAPDLSVSDPFLTGSVEFSGRTLARLLAAPERFYGTVSTLAQPGGAARGQLARQTDDAPPAFSYQTPVTYTEGTPIATNVATSIGGAITSFVADQPMPAGLSVDPTTGAITGTPIGASAATDYSVTATNAAGSSSSIVNITVNPIAPTNLSYASPVTYTVGTAITANTPTNGGGVITSYGVSPALPGGLSLNTSTGAITGTPTQATSQATYTVTGSNGAGSTTFGVVITVNASLQPPSGLSYTSPVTYSTGAAITTNAPTVGGGAVASYGVSPALPAGLSLNTTTGDITGTPTQVTSAADYTVTATNAAGSTTATVNITVVLGAPANLSYSPSSMIGYVNVAFGPVTPTVGGGGGTLTYSISPALPAGFTFNTSTGAIGGTPTTTSGNQQHTVTVSNAAGSTTTTITSTVPF